MQNASLIIINYCIISYYYRLVGLNEVIFIIVLAGEFLNKEKTAVFSGFIECINLTTLSEIIIRIIFIEQ